MKNVTRNIMIALTGLTVITAAPANAATTQQDVQTCREAMDNRAGVDLSDYRLRFEYKKGNNQGRTLTIKAIPRKNGQSFRFSCTLDKDTVTALNGTPTVKFAQR